MKSISCGEDEEPSRTRETICSKTTTKADLETSRTCRRPLQHLTQTSVSLELRELNTAEGKSLEKAARTRLTFAAQLQLNRV